MKALKAVLVAIGVLCVVCVLGAVLPWSALARFFEFFGVPALQPAPFLVYCVRTSSLACALIGLFFLVLSTDPLRYRPMLVLAVAGLFLLAVACLLIGWSVGMRPPWYFVDVAISLVAALLICKFWPGEAPPAPQEG